MRVIFPPAFRYSECRSSSTSFHASSISLTVIVALFDDVPTLRGNTSNAKQFSLFKPFRMSAPIDLFLESKVEEERRVKVPGFKVGLSVMTCKLLSGIPEGLRQ